MVASCAAVGCHKRQTPGCGGCGLKFYRIPVDDPEKRKLWIAAINRKHWVPGPHDRLCSLHFISGINLYCFKSVIHMFNKVMSMLFNEQYHFVLFHMLLDKLHN